MSRSWFLNLFLFGMAFFLPDLLFSQDSSLEIVGFVKDKNNNKFLNGVSITLKNKLDSSTYLVSVSREDGNFRIKGIPSKDYIISFSHLIYESITIDLPKHADNIINLDTLYLFQHTNRIEEITLKPPLYYNKDTLEINTDSFKLDSNAVVSDLFKMVPELVIWGNGLITFKGKKIESFLLNGKKFLSGDPNIIINNLPKNSASTIQIYNTKNTIVSQDSIYQMNIKTKSNKISYFGILSNLIGNRYDSSIGLTVFSKNTFQASAFFNANNVNKTISNSTDFLESTTYKETSKIQSNNILKLGNNKFKVYGIDSKYSFTKQSDNIEINQLSASFNSASVISRNSSKSSNENKELDFKQEIEDKKELENRNENLDLTYELKKDHLKFTNSFQAENKNSILLNENKLRYRLNGIITDNTSKETNDAMSNILNNNSLFMYKFEKTGIAINSSINVSYNNSEQKGSNILTDSIQNKYRTFQKEEKNKRLNFTAKLLNISLSRKNKIWLILENTNYLIKSDLHRIFQDNEKINDDLSYNNYRRESGSQFTSGVNFKKYSELTNRFSKSFSLDMGFDFSTFNQRQNSNNLSLKDNLTTNFLFPKLNLYIEKTIPNKYKDIFELKVHGKAMLPDQERRAVIKDDFNPFYILQGNADLKAEERYIGNIKYSRERSYYSHYFSFSYNLVNNAFINRSKTIDNKSMIIDYLNYGNLVSRTNFDFLARKNFRAKNKNAVISLNFIWNYNDLPIVSEDNLVKSKVHDLNLNSNLDLELNNNFLFSFNSTLNKYYIKRSRNTSLLSFYQETNLQYRLKKDLKLTIAWLYNVNSSNQYENRTSNSILNFESTYRVLKGKNLEFMFNIWDILNNNKALISTFDGLYFKTGEVNRIRQYTTFGIRYYLRKFD